MDKVLEMLQLQQTLNDATNGIGWEKGFTKHGKVIDWRRCSYLECAELIESYPWKHWKNIDAKADTANIKIEAVDIWHFIMSQALQDYKIEDLGNIETLAEHIKALSNFESFTTESIPTDKSYYAQIQTVESLIKILFCEKDTSKLFVAFIEVALQSGLNIDSLYSLYVGKNILNKFRQDHGYKEGSYIKIWKGKEDNVVMQSILEKQDIQKQDITAQSLYDALSKAYPNT
ncbi:MAG: dUTP diphosphatase [Sulfurovum sp.]|nr:dUTP diphosphatase [Sulfurovum sp.]